MSHAKRDRKRSGLVLGMLVLLLPGTALFAADPYQGEQVVSITGRIVDRAGAGVASGSVELVGTTLSTLSNAAGEFSLTGGLPVAPPAFSTDKIQLNINCPGRPLRTLILPSTQQSLGQIKIFSKPNFVIIFTDDQGYADLGTFGSGTAPDDGNWLAKDQIAIPTPRIDKMADEGLKFTNFYAQTYCGPSRAQLMTGSYAARVARKDNTKGTGVNGLFNGSGGIDVDPSEITIAEALKAAGYATGMVGKWKLHIAYDNENIGPAELYDLQAEIGERQDLAASNPEVVDKIMEFAKAGIADIGDFHNVGKGERRVP